MTQPITDEELADAREAVENDDWCVLCRGSHPTKTYRGGLYRGSLCRCDTYISIRSILARIDAAEGR